MHVDPGHIPLRMAAQRIWSKIFKMNATKKAKTFITWVWSALACGIFLAAAAEAQEYRIRAGDTLRVEVLEDATINREVLVGPDGSISVPLVGTVSVGGKTRAQVSDRLATALAPNFAKRPNVLVSLLSQRSVTGSVSRKVYVIGEVNKPGYVDVGRNTTLLQALALAGGVTDFAAVKRVQLRRLSSSGETVYRFDYGKVLAGQSNVGTSKVVGGDVIVVPARRLFE